MPSSEIQVKSVTCCRPAPESKSAIRPIEMPSVQTAKSSEAKPARRPPCLSLPGRSEAITPPARGRNMRIESIRAYLTRHDQEVEPERRKPSYQQQRVVAQESGLGDAHDRVAGTHGERSARGEPADHDALDHARCPLAEGPHRQDDRTVVELGEVPLG